MRDATILTIIIVNWNTEDFLRQCLASLYREVRLDRERVQIIVVDNASSDGSAHMVSSEYPEVELVVAGENMGFARANNIALSRCTGRYVLLLNPDTLVTDDSLDRLVRYLDGHEMVGAIGSRLVNGDGSLQRWTGGRFPSLWGAASHYLFLGRILPRFCRPGSMYLENDVTEPIGVDWVSGACMMLRREILGERIFDESYFMYGEDIELCHRLGQAGYRVVYHPGSTVVHYHGQSMKRQSEDSVLLMPLKGPRRFFLKTHHRVSLWAFDALTAVGFGLRGILFGLMSIVRPGRGYGERAASSTRYMTMAVRVMFER